MFFPRDINDIILNNSPLSSLAHSITTTRSPNKKKVFFLVVVISPDHSDPTRQCDGQHRRGLRLQSRLPPIPRRNAAEGDDRCYNTIQKGGLLRNNMLVFDFFCGSGILGDELISIIRRDYPYLQRRRFLTDFRHGFEKWPVHDAPNFDHFVAELEEERRKAPLMRRGRGRE